MDNKELTAYCLSKPCAFMDYPFGPDPAVIKVGSRIFALILIKNEKAWISLKCDPVIAQSLRQEYPAIAPGYHLNKEHWNTIAVNGSVPDDKLAWMIDHSYELVYKSLPKAERERIYKAK